MKLNQHEIEHSKLVRKLAPECTLFLKSDGSFPLAEPCQVALFGNGARNTIKGGTGSGDVYSHFTICFEKGLERVGFDITTRAWLDAYDAVYKEKRDAWRADLKKNSKGITAFMSLMGATMLEPDYELPLDYPGDLAIYVLSRISGEGTDRKPVRGDFKLTETELRDIIYLNSHYEKFLLVLNTGGPVDLSELGEVKNILLFSQLGALSGIILADLLLGVSYPSGKLAATWSAYEDYCQIGSFGERDETEYKEGIYVGYRYFDTVGKQATFPFGYGLSYTTFEISGGKASVDGKRITVTANVKNTGSFKGKEVVQLYVSVPAGKLDQPYQVLAAFAKTEELQPEESTIVTLAFDLDELASYDTETASYILENGVYKLRLGNCSRCTEPVADVVLDADIVIRKAKNVLGDCGFEDWKPEAAKADVDAAAADAADTADAAVDAATTDLPVLSISASSFETAETVYDPEYEIDPFVKGLTDEELCYIGIGSFGSSPLSIVGNQSKKVAGAAGDFTTVLEKKGFPCIVTADGPAGIRISRRFVIDKKGKRQALGNDMLVLFADAMPKFILKAMSLTERKPRRGETVYEQYCTMIPIAAAVAQSFNVQMSEQLGDIIGTEMESFGVDFWLAPAMNIHRNPLCGRNFEYYSEDPLLTGKMAASITRGVQKHPGCGVTIKHYAANNQETNRYSNNSHVSERAMREIYLKGFGICVRESAPLSVMTSYNLLNGVHTSEHRGLIEDILRSEFGFDGIVMTDWVVAAMHKGGSYEAPVSWKVANAGGDVLMPGSKAHFDMLVKGLKDGQVTREQLEINATRMYRMACKLTEAKK